MPEKIRLAILGATGMAGGEALLHHEFLDEIVSLPSTPEKLFLVQDEMPEPKRDVYKGDGMAVVVGDIQQRAPNRISLTTLTHNLRRGATWAGRQGLELYLKEYKGMFR